MKDRELGSLISKVLKRASDIDSPEKTLIFAIIERSVKDYFGGGSAENARDARDYLETNRVASLAQMVNLTPEYIHLVLKEAKDYAGRDI